MELITDKVIEVLDNLQKVICFEDKAEKVINFEAGKSKILIKRGRSALESTLNSFLVYSNWIWERIFMEITIEISKRNL